MYHPIQTVIPAPHMIFTATQEEPLGQCPGMTQVKSLTKHKIVMWLCILAGALWIAAGLRDLLAPGFFNISGRTVTGSSIALNFAIGIVFLIIGVSQSAGMRNFK